MNMPCLTFDEVLGDALCWPPTFAAVDFLAGIEVIFGRDRTSQEVFLVYGRDRLRQLMNDDPDSEVDVLVIDVNTDSNELDKLLALVQLAKNGNDYVEAA